jgi:hypothetical protein
VAAARRRLALAVSTFLDWYDFLGAGVSAWDALRRTDVAIFVAGVLAAASGAWLGFGDVGPERRVVAPLGAAAGVLGAVAVIVRMASPRATCPWRRASTSRS